MEKRRKRSRIKRSVANFSYFMRTKLQNHKKKTEREKRRRRRRAHANTGAEKSLASFIEDFTVAILLCLPVKSMARFRKRNMDVSEVEIYNLSSDLWRTYSHCIPYMVPRGDPGVFLNGALHWLANTSNEYSSQSQVILSFDMEDEIFKEVAQPEHMDDFDYKFVGVLRGCLCLLCSVSKVSFEVWEMKDYGVRESWSKVFKTDTQLMATLDIPSYHYLRSAVTLQDGETLLQVRLHGDKDFSSYEWEKRSSVVRICLDEKEKHEIRSEYGYKKHMVQMVAYRESLVSVNSGTHVGDVKQEEKDYDEAIENLWI